MANVGAMLTALGDPTASGDLRAAVARPLGRRPARRRASGHQARRVPAPAGAQGRRAGLRPAGRHPQALPGRSRRARAAARPTWTRSGRARWPRSPDRTQELRTVETIVEAVRREVVVEVGQAAAFEIFTADMTSWWPAHHHIGSAPIQEIVDRAAGRRALVHAPRGRRGDRHGRRHGVGAAGPASPSPGRSAPDSTSTRPRHLHHVRFTAGGPGPHPRGAGARSASRPTPPTPPRCARRSRPRARGRGTLAAYAAGPREEVRRRSTPPPTTSCSRAPAATSRPARSGSTSSHPRCSADGRHLRRSAGPGSMAIFRTRERRRGVRRR